MNALQSWWALREVRERWLIAVLLALFGVCTYVFAVVAPLNEAASRARQDYDRAVSSAAEQQSKAQVIIAASSGLIRAPDVSLESLRQDAERQGLTVQSAVSERGGAVRLVFESVDAASLTPWIAALPRTRGASIERLQIQRSDPGRVSATLIVRTLQ